MPGCSSSLRVGGNDTPCPKVPRVAVVCFVDAANNTRGEARWAALYAERHHWRSHSIAPGLSFRPHAPDRSRNVASRGRWSSSPLRCRSRTYPTTYFTNGVVSQKPSSSTEAVKSHVGETRDPLMYHPGSSAPLRYVLSEEIPGPPWAT